MMFCEELGNFQKNGYTNKFENAAGFVGKFSG